MIPTNLSEFGTLVLYLILVATGYTFAVSIAAGRGRPRLLVAARSGMLGTCALVGLATFALAYAFLTHDFRIRYVARYSDRSMPIAYLITSLWGGQDGSLLWWLFILAGYTTACVAWLRNRYQQLQPYIIATLSVVMAFFAVLMLFAANPFATSVSGAPLDGEGLNPLLQNYWMVIHPPNLYMGMIGPTIPFAFVIAALVTGRLNEEWIYAVRTWAIIGWLFLSTGNLLGSIWSYEELGWGGYWAWDPVENASFMPWLTATAFLHSVMIQERRGMMKVWNVSLVIITFLMTIFGTFLTRSGLIASVHSFARSDLGVYFLVFMGGAAVLSIGLVIWRLPKLRSENRLDSVLSREFAFLVNNWILLGSLLFVLGSTTYPLISELIRGEPVSVGPTFYNKWMAPLGLILLFLTGVGPLIGWRKATGKNLLRAFAIPTAMGLLVGVLHLVFGSALGFPAIVAGEDIYDTAVGRALAAFASVLPLVSFALCGFVLTTIVQEFVQGTRARLRTTKENPLFAVINLVRKARRRYGGYIVHVGIVLMFFGWTGGVYGSKTESSLDPGQRMRIHDYSIRYDGATERVDPNKRMTFANVTVFRGGRAVGRLHPGKFQYRTHPDSPTTEVDILTSARDDLYLVLGAIDRDTGRATLRAHFNPLVVWIWLGGIVLLIGTAIGAFPSVSEVLAWLEQGRLIPSSGSRRAAAAAAAGLLLLLGTLGWATIGRAQDDGSSSLHAGHVDIHGEREQQLFDRLNCMCGTCARLSLSTCACGFAEQARGEVRSMIAQGLTTAQIMSTWRGRYGAKALTVPEDRGVDRIIYIVPMVAIALGAAGVVLVARRWLRRNRSDVAAAKADAARPDEAGDKAARVEADRQIDDELDRLREDS